MNKKTELRKKYAYLRDSIPKERRIDDAEEYAKGLSNLSIISAQRRCFVYVSFGSEVSTELLIDKIIMDKGLAVVPLLIQKRILCGLSE